MLDSMVNIDAQLNELTFREAEMAYTRIHPPSYAGKSVGRWKMRSEVQQSRAMPKTQQEIVYA